MRRIALSVYCTLRTSFRRLSERYLMPFVLATDKKILSIYRVLFPIDLLDSNKYTPQRIRLVALKSRFRDVASSMPNQVIRQLNERLN